MNRAGSETDDWRIGSKALGEECPRSAPGSIPVGVKLMALPWMPFYWGDYFKKTLHLSTEEHGAYMLLIGAYWERGKAFPDDDLFFAHVTKMSTKKWKMVRPKIIEFFAVSEGLWVHERVEFEILRSSERQASASANGKAGGLAKSKLTTTTITDKEVVNLKDFVVGIGKGRRGLEMTPENRLALFQRWLAKTIGRDGWAIVGKAADPDCAEYSESLEFCRDFARKNGKGWPHQWPK